MRQRQITPVEFECQAYLMYAAFDHAEDGHEAQVRDWYGPGASDEDEANYIATHRSRYGY